MKRGPSAVGCALLRFAAVLMVVFAVGAGAQQQVYVITKDGADFKATRNGNPVGTSSRVSDVLDTIKARSFGDPVTIQLGGGATDILDMGTAGLIFRVSDVEVPAWGEVTLTGSAKAGANVDLVSVANASADTSGFVLKSSANLATGSGNGYPFYLTGVGRTSITITGGTLLSNGSGVVANIPASSQVKVTGGTLRAASNYALSVSGVAEISGGKFEGSENRAVINGSGNNSKISISGSAEIIGNTDASAAVPAVQISSGGSLELSGGTITNEVENGDAVFISGTTSSLTLTGNTPPQITGGIAANYGGAIIAKSFAPGTATYTLTPRAAARSEGAVAVVGGAALSARFKYEHKYYELVVSGGDIVIKLKAGATAPSYAVTSRVTGGFTVTEGTEVVKDSTENFLLDIQEKAEGRPCSILLGSAAAPLQIGAYPLTFDQAVGDWGRVTLSGGVSMSNSLALANGVSVSSSLSISNMAVSAVAVNVASGSDFAHTGGTLSSMIDLVDGSVMVTGGTVHSIQVAGASTDARELAVSGGKVGDATFVGSAITLSAGSNAVISGTAVVASADVGTDPLESGTIRNNGGSLTISSGKVSNEATGHAVCITSTATDTAVVIISGGEITGKNTSSGSDGGVVRNSSGSLEITGGTISNTSSTTGTAVVNSSSARISGTANISSSSHDQSNAVVLNYGTMSISGGTIAADSGARAINNYSSSAYIVVSDSAKITAKIPTPEGATSANTGTIYNLGSSTYSTGGLYLFGGTVANTAVGDTLKAAIFSTSSMGPSSNVILGGSPTIDGDICHPNNPLEVNATGSYAFAPGAKVYKMRRMSISDGRVMVTNGAGFTSNFAIDTVGSYYVYRFATNGNDIVATQGEIFNVNFSINRATTGTAPKTIPVVEGGTIGELAMPSTNPYASPVTALCPAGGCANDGEWHIRTGQSDAGEIVGEPFVFGVSPFGTKVTAAIALTLLWTDKVSVLAATRVVPGANEAEVVAIAPVTVTAGEFTVGPNPVARHTGAVSFFWSGAKVTSGSVLVYDATGNFVKKIGVGGGRSGTAASWDLTDASGRPVAQGIYAVRGVIKTKAGRSEKVSAFISVR